VDAVGKEIGKERVRDGAPIAKDFTLEAFDQARDGPAVVDVGGGEATRQKLPHIINQQMEREALAPAKRILAPAREARKHAVPGGTLRMTDSQQSGVHKRTPFTLALTCLEISTERDQGLLHELDKPRVAD